MIETRSLGSGVSVRVSGDPVEILEELTAVIRAARDIFTEQSDEETSDTLITFCGKMAYAETDDEKDDITKELRDFLSVKASAVFEELLEEG